MKTIHVLSGALLLCFITATSLSSAQTKNAATDKQRQENLDKLQKKQAKQRAAYNKMTDEQKAVARTKALERKTGKTSGTKPISKTGLGTAKSKGNTLKKEGVVNAKPINVSKKSKPAPVWKTPASGSKTIKTKPTVNANADKKPAVTAEPVLQKPTIHHKTSTTATKVIGNSKDKK